jgi:hypothetical protein
MTRAELYGLITKAMRAAGELSSWHPGEDVWQMCAESLADELAKIHPHFDRERFLRECEGRTPTPPPSTLLHSTANMLLALVQTSGRQKAVELLVQYGAPPGAPTLSGVSADRLPALHAELERLCPPSR